MPRCRARPRPVDEERRRAGRGQRSRRSCGRRGRSWPMPITTPRCRSAGWPPTARENSRSGAAARPEQRIGFDREVSRARCSARSRVERMCFSKGAACRFRIVSILVGGGLRPAGRAHAAVRTGIPASDPCGPGTCMRPRQNRSRSATPNPGAPRRAPNPSRMARPWNSLLPRRGRSRASSRFACCGCLRCVATFVARRGWIGPTRSNWRTTPPPFSSLGRVRRRVS